MIWLFDNGHGGICGARYLTRGKRSPEVIPGLGVYEGEFNRDIVKRVVGALNEQGIDTLDLVPGAANMKLRDRIRRANDWSSFKCHLISIHANADGRDGKWTKANGITIFHYPGSVKGEWLANIAHGYLMQHCIIKSRGIKTARFAVLRRTRMPAILVEHGFMTHKGDARKLASDKFRQQIAAAYVEMILNIERG
jgi:N-acetylmuramoyl-L-alanine amidase